MENKENKVTESLLIILQDLINDAKHKYKRLVEINAERKVLVQEIDERQQNLAALLSIMKGKDIGISEEMMQTLKEIASWEQASLESYPKPSLIIQVSEPIAPTEYIKKLFNVYPSKDWKPPEFRDQLELLKEKNLLDSTADNLLWVVHSSLKTLYTQHFIDKDEEKGTYKKHQAIRRRIIYR